MPDGTIANPGTDPTTQSQLQVNTGNTQTTNGTGLINTPAPTGNAVGMPAPGLTPTTTANTTGQYSGLINQGLATTPPPAAPAVQAGTNPNGNTPVSPNPNLGAPPVTATTVDPSTMTVAGQVSNIIASGSPLMEQATTAANNAMNQRGLINSTMGLTAAQSSLYAAAVPIAQQDAQTYYAADAATASAMNASAIAALQSATTTAGYDSQQIIARIQSDTSLSTQQMSDYSAQIIAAVQANTSLSVQQQADLTTMAKDMADNSASTNIANIQSNTSLTAQQMQDDTQTAITNLNNASAVNVQNLVNQGNLANIASNGTINEQITQMTNDNKSLLQTSSSAQSLYTQALTNLSNIITNPNLDEDQKTTALNDTVSTLNDGLNILSQIVGLTPGLSSDLSFSNGQDIGTTPSGNPTPQQTLQDLFGGG